MNLHWSIKTLNDICVKITDGAHNSPKSVVNGKPMVSVKDLTRFGVNLANARHISNDEFEKLVNQGCRPEVGDVLIAKDGNSALDTVCTVKKELDIVLLSSVAILRPNKNLVDSDFLKYYFSSSDTISYLKNNFISGAAIPRVVLRDFKKAEISLPSLQEQKKISGILNSLEDRIENLHQINNTLESIAQALFKSWFIDFDPVHAKAEGREPEGMDAETAALFPDSFEEAELGLVPKGWGVKAVYDIATYINGASYRSFEPNDERRGLPIIKIAELKSGVTTQTRYSSVNMPDKYKINYGDILFSWSGNPDTSIDTFIWSQGGAWLNQHIFRVLPHSNQERSFVLMILRHLKPVFAEIARNKQTTGLGHVTIADLKRLKIVTPPSTILDKWNAVVTPILDQAFIMDCRSKILSHLRDTLLPRLISGQLIPDKVGEMV